MYVSAADNDNAGVTGILGTPAQGVWSTGGVAKLHSEPSEARSPMVQQRRLEPAPLRVGLRNGPAGGLAGPYGLGMLDEAQGVGCDQLLCNNVNCTNVFTTAWTP